MNDMRNEGKTDICAEQLGGNGNLPCHENSIHNHRI